MLKRYLITAAVAACAGAAAAWFAADSRWQAEWDAAEQGRLKNDIRTVTRTVYIERAAAEKTAEADAKGQKELNDAKREINRLRTELAAGTRRLRGQSASCAAGRATAASSGVDNGGRAEQGDGGSGVGTHILAIADHAVTAIAQRDACVDILRSERELLNAASAP